MEGRIKWRWHALDYSVFKVIYLKSSANEYAFVSIWDNQGESLADATKRIEADGKTKYLGSWVDLRKDSGRFMLTSGGEELIKNGLFTVPYAYPEKLQQMASGKTLVWNTANKTYALP